MSRKHHHFRGAEVSCCVKYFLFGFNILFWVSKWSKCWSQKSFLKCWDKVVLTLCCEVFEAGRDS
ncbi:unnamed protein product [Tetraodon nigroviridis]|uniref:(spotted green pufferfish) hypothetical protein n=1 Tax=Tetraodon nigroviridis TaxID=99883 RepID=Q4SJM6_TETNG|nr:unnamed protein product [Tetraodon nigroviridis]